MQCIVSQPLPFLVLQNAYLVAKIQIYIGLEQTGRIADNYLLLPLPSFLP